MVYQDDRFSGPLKRKAYGEAEDREAYTIDNSVLEYRPQLEKEKRERTAWEQDITEPQYSLPPIHYDIGDGIVVDLIKRYDNFKNKLNQKLKEIEKEYSKETINFPEYANDDIRKAMEDLNLEGDFDFSAYIKALEKRNTPAGDYLVEIAERQFESLNGNIYMEIYHDYFELLKEVEVTEEYLYRQSTGKMFSNIDTSQEDWEEQLLKEELDWKESKKRTDSQRENRDSIIKEAFLFNPSIYPLQKALKHKEEPDYKEKNLTYNQLKDTMHISVRKLNNSQQVFTYIESLESIQEKMNSEEMIEKVMNIAIEPQEKVNNLTQFEQMLIVSTEKNNNEKRHYKNTLRNVYNQEFLLKNLDELSLHNQIYEESIAPLSTVLKIYNEPQDDETTIFLETLSQSMIETRNEQKRKTKDFNSLNYGNYSLRMEKIKEVKAKEESRQTFKSLEKIIYQLKEKGGE